MQKELLHNVAVALLGYIEVYGIWLARGRLQAGDDIESKENAIKGLDLPRLGK